MRATPFPHAVSRLSVVSLAAALACASCASPTPVSELRAEKALEVRLDANARAHEPGRQIKFFVDVWNRSGELVDLADLNVEIRVLGSGRSILLRQDWTYRWPQEIHLRSGSRLTVPVLPERGVELPLEHLPEGTYDLVAVINDRFESSPYQLRIYRPDLRLPLRRV